MPDAGMGGWPDVADHAIARLPPEHLSVGWYVILLIAAVGAAIAGKHLVARLLGPAPAPVPPSTALLSAEQIKEVVARGVDAGIHGRFADIRARVDDLRERVGGLEEALGELRQESAWALAELRKESASRHEQNITRLTALEVGTRLDPDAPGRPRRRS